MCVQGDELGGEIEDGGGVDAYGRCILLAS